MKDVGKVRLGEVGFGAGLAGSRGREADSIRVMIIKDGNRK